MKYIKELLDLSLDEQRAALSYVATEKGLPQVVVEKDLYYFIFYLEKMAQMEFCLKVGHLYLKDLILSIDFLKILM